MMVISLNAYSPGAIFPPDLARQFCRVPGGQQDAIATRRQASPVGHDAAQGLVATLAAKGTFVVEQTQIPPAIRRSGRSSPLNRPHGACTERTRPAIPPGVR
jgi:hypothetical protein